LTVAIFLLRTDNSFMQFLKTTSTPTSDWWRRISGAENYDLEVRRTLALTCCRKRTLEAVRCSAWLGHQPHLNIWRNGSWHRFFCSRPRVVIRQASPVWRTGMLRSPLALFLHRPGEDLFHLCKLLAACFDKPPSRLSILR